MSCPVLVVCGVVLGCSSVVAVSLGKGKRVLTDLQIDGQSDYILYLVNGGQGGWNGHVDSHPYQKYGIPDTSNHRRQSALPVVLVCSRYIQLTNQACRLVPRT